MVGSVGPLDQVGFGLDVELDGPQGVEQRRRVFFECDEVLGQIVARVRDMVVDLFLQVSEQPHDLVEALVEGHGDVLEERVDEVPELVGVLFGEAEHLGDDVHRDVLGVHGGCIDDVETLDLIEEPVAEGSASPARARPRPSERTPEAACGERHGDTAGPT